MTVVVGFHCRDGLVIGADSMLTPSLGGISVGHHKGVKVHLLSGGQLFAFAGDQGQAARFQLLADSNHALPAGMTLALDYPLALTSGIIQQFISTGINHNIEVNTLLGFEHNGERRLCVFEGPLQPRLLDDHHYYVALGSGKLSADPFLRFLADIFCKGGPPTVREATLLTTWAIQHVIDVNPGGVAGPIKIAVMERDPGGIWQTRYLSDNEVDDHGQSIESALDQLRAWKDALGGEGDVEAEVPPPPMPQIPNT